MRKTLSLVLAVVMMLVLLPAIKLNTTVAEDAATATLMTTLPEDGDRIVIHNTQYNKAMGACGTKSTYYNEGKDLEPADGQLTGVTEDLIWDVTVTEEGNYRFSQEGKFLSMGASYASMPYDDVNKDWTINTLGEGYSIKNVARECYVEWYASKNYFSGYNKIAEGSEGMFIFRFFLIDEETPETPDDPIITPDTGAVVILFTNDVHCQIDYSAGKSWGYGKVAGLKKMYESYGNDVILIDAGDHVQGGPIGSLTNGEAIIDILNAVGYDLAIPGNHEFDYGLNQFVNVLAKEAEYPYLSANFVNLPGEEPVFDAYKIIEAKGKKIAFVGLSTPESITKSTPTYFMNADQSAYIYGFCQDDTGAGVVAAAQTAIDAAKAEGAEYVIVVGHMGIDTQSSPWTSPEVIAQLSGVDAFIDGHSHSVINTTVKDKDGKDVLHGQTGTKLANVGMLTIFPDGHLEMELLKVDGEVNPDPDPDAQTVIDSINGEFKELLATVVAHTDHLLTTVDPATIDQGWPTRWVRNRETNLGDLCADAYRTMFDADVAFVNGGGVRANIAEGDITFQHIINVHPFGNTAVLAEVTGQQILDALEMGARVCPGENGGFLQVSGLIYEIHTYVDANVEIDSEKMWLGPKDAEGEYRVKNVKIRNKATGLYEPLDLTKKYTLASHNYMLIDMGDGFAMFGKNITILEDSGKLDNQVLIDYIQSMPEVDGVHQVQGYENPEGEKRIRIYTEKPEEGAAPEGLEPVFYADKVSCLEAGEYVDGQVVYAYEIKLKGISNLLKIVSMQIFVELPEELEFLEAKSILPGATDLKGFCGFNIKDGLLSFAWMDQDGVNLEDDTAVLTLYFNLPEPIEQEVNIEIVEPTSFGYVNGGNVSDASTTYGVELESGSIEFQLPESIKLYGEDVKSKDICVIEEDGKILYRYDILVKELPESGLMINSAQIFVSFDHEMLEFRKVESDFEWEYGEKGNKLMLVWASEEDVNLQNGVLLSIYFARKDAPLDQPVPVEFTENLLGYESSFSVLYGGQIVNIDADTTDGSITFTILFGDANGDGEITAADAAAILRAVVGLQNLQPECMVNADVDGDGEVTAADAALILRLVVHLIDQFPVEEP